MEKYLNLTRELKKIMKYEGDGYAHHCLSVRNKPEEPRKNNEELEIQEKIETIQMMPLLKTAGILRILDY